MRNLAWLALVASATGAALRADPSPATPAEPPAVKFLFPSGVQQGQSRPLKISGKAGSAPHRVWTSDQRMTLAVSEAGDAVEVTAAADAPAGLYLARITNAAGSSELLPIIVGLLPEISESDLTAESRSSPLSLPTTVSGVLAKSGEVDAYRVTLEAGQTLIASVDSRRLLATPADVVLQLVSEQGFVITQNDDHHGMDPQVVHTATSAGPVTVRLFAFPADPNSTIGFAGGETYAYRLTLTTGPFVDHLFPLTWSAGTESSLECVGWNLPDDASSATAADGATVAVNLPYPGSLMTNLWQSSPGPVVAESEDGTTATLPIPCTASGQIRQPSEVDRYRFTAAAGQTLEFQVAAQAYDSPLDPVLRVTAVDGKLLKESDDVGKDDTDVRVDVKFPADGEYEAVVTDRFGHGGLRYAYLLSISEKTPHVRLSIKQTHYVVSADKPVEIPVTVQRGEGFKLPVSISLRAVDAELPEGITAAPVESAAEGDSSKSVTLKIETTGQSAFSGLVTIRGTSEGNEPVGATAASPVSRLSVDTFWLTASPKPAEPTAPAP